MGSILENAQGLNFLASAGTAGDCGWAGWSGGDLQLWEEAWDSGLAIGTCSPPLSQKVFTGP